MQKKFSFSKYLLIICFSLCMGIAYVANSSSTSPASNASKSKEDVLLIQSAASCSIEKDKDQKHLYKVTLQKVASHLNYVSDRPARTVGKITLEKYLQLWIPGLQNGFEQTPPNVIIHGSSKKNDGKGLPHYFAIELSHPKYDVRSGTLVYQGKRLSGEGSELPDNLEIDHITIVIDGVCLACWNN